MNLLIQLNNCLKRITNAGESKDKKRENARLFRESIQNSDDGIRNKPLQLFLEVTSRCNLRCQKCGMNYDPCFHYRVPRSLRDGRSHSIRVTVAGGKFDLSSTPKLITCEMT